MEKVLGHLETAIELDPDFLPALERLVKFYNTGSFMSRPGTDHRKPREKAYELAQRLLFLNSQYATAHVRMASCLLWRRNFHSAERSAQRAMELKSYDPYVLNVLGTALVYLGDLDAAEKYYGMAEERLLHDMDFVRTDYGELFYLRHDFERALSWLETPEVRTPYRTLFWRAPTLAQLGYLVEARQDVETMIEDLRKRWQGSKPFEAEAGIQWMCDMKPYRRTAHRDLLVDGFNKAGVKITAQNFP
ncbi:tetratricopeptide repeat protein [Litoreibacter arenae]|uniref:Transcriptional regulator, SARP family n=1 Tax=Litoreibacter arenae DSM 19593 TaxID=1123360 RepID=S9RJI4_9RHOB|nr:SARP family transcriptional regulator [Litoreibacter arenae]EPX78275.1 transcriptional regulator, SARP family [Litoreibacter arenae DSM 19593]